MKPLKLVFLLTLLSTSFMFTTHAALPNIGTNGKPFPSLAPMVKKVNPAVVNISTFSTQKQRQNPLLEDPFFRHFFNIPEDRYRQKAPKKRQQSAGSGVIVGADGGVVMTNYHVIKDADEVQVSLYDGRSYDAKILGFDPDLDIAILQIAADDLVEAPIADSSTLEVGDFVVAIGNPFGLGQTVTTGVVSALGRSGLGIEGYENFIQTDASINPGNSGGALVNLAGELVGINTAIIAPSGGNVGIGFAIPANMAKASMLQIIKYGEVKRGNIGVGIQDITPDLRQAFNLKNGQLGVLITNVSSGSTADKSGLKPGDIVLEVDGRPTRSTGQLRSQIGIKSIGEKARLTILRDGNNKIINVKIAKPESLLSGNEIQHPLLEGARFENSSDGKSVVVTKLIANSAASYSGLRRGDLIVAANKRRIYDIASFKKALSVNKKSVLLQIRRNGSSLFIIIR